MSLAISGSYSREAFLARQAAGEFNAQLSYEDYLAWRQRAHEHARQARAEFYGTEQPEHYENALALTPEDEATLDRAWAVVAAEKEAVDDDLRLAARVA